MGRKKKSKRQGIALAIPKSVEHLESLTKVLSIDELLRFFGSERMSPALSQLYRLLRYTPKGARWTCEQLEGSDEERARLVYVLRREGEERLDLSGVGLSRFPPVILEQGGPLVALRLSRNALTALPEGLGELRKLERLDVSGNALTALPDVFDRLGGLRELFAQSNKLKALPESLRGHASLETLDVGANAFTTRAARAALLDMVLSLPALQRCDGMPGHTRGRLAAALGEVLQSAPVGERRDLLALLVDDPEAIKDADKRRRRVKEVGGQGWAEAPLERVLRAVDGTWPRLRELAEAELARRSAGAPLEAGSEVTVIGNMARLKRTELKETLAERGVAYSPQLGAATTHVVYGTSPDLSKHAIKAKQALTFLDEAAAEQLIIAHGEASGALFLQAVEAPADPALEAGGQVGDMLLSNDADTVKLALELIKSGGLPAAAQTGLFVVAKAFADSKVRGAARKLLKRHGSKGVQAALASRGALYSSGSRAERKTRDALSQYARLCDELDWLQVARYLHAQHGVGLSYFTAQASAEQRYEFFRAQVNDGRLDYHGLVHPGYAPEYTNPYAYEHYQSVPFPQEVLQLSDLVELQMNDCMLAEVPAGIGALSQLEVLDLRGNFLRDLPGELATLKRLRVLRVGNNEFEEVPAVLLKMTWLEALELRGNRARNEQAPLRIFDAEHFSGCAIDDGRAPGW